jgi:hypothetical protein
MSLRTSFAVVVSGLIGFSLAAQPPGAAQVEKSPHAAALELVFRKEAARIRAVDKGDWWMDTKERTWSVRRPFAPGWIDSTHMFNVTYRIDGKKVAAWFVDTRSGKVAPEKAVQLR